MNFECLFSYIVSFILFLLFLYIFIRLVIVLYRKGILKDIDIFYITSNPWEFKKYKNNIENSSKDKKN